MLPSSVNAEQLGQTESTMWKYATLAALLVVALVVGVALGSNWTARQESNHRFADWKVQRQRGRAHLKSRCWTACRKSRDGFFFHAITPGTPLRTTVRLQMEGKFLLGDKYKFQTYSMSAKQVLSPPDQFFWMPIMKNGLLEITGSDAIVGGDASTRFWINGLFPVVDHSGTADLARSALSRSAMEAVWAPASLLPQNGVEWKQTGPDTAKITFSTGTEPVYILLDEKGSVREIRTMRWSDTNPSATFRLQPFGGTMQSENTFGGYTIPTIMQVGNQFGTEDYLPFFQAEIRAVVPSDVGSELWIGALLTERRCHPLWH